MENTKRGFLYAFLAIALCGLLAPFIATPFVNAGESASADEERVEWPQVIKDDGSFNAAFLSEAGAWFESHFAFRNEMLQLDQGARGLFGATTSEKVIMGSDGWLYYSGTLPDYEGTAMLTERQLQTIAYNLQLAQGYVQSQGATFTLTLAPNKNTLYPGHMPSRFVEATSQHNAERLVPYLNASGVKYVDMLATLKQAAGASDVSLYYAKDTHWNEQGASVGFDALMGGIGLAHRTFGSSDFTWVDADNGDLNVMINPLGGVTESVPKLSRVYGFAFMGTDDVEEPVIETVSVTEEAKLNGTLLMYRDSFGNNLLPYMAESFERAYFTKYTPYDLTLVPAMGARHVVIERAERNLYSFAANPPIMPAPRVTVAAMGDVASATTISASADGSLWKIEGWFDGVTTDKTSPVFVMIEPEGAPGAASDAFVAFRTEALTGSTDTAPDASADGNAVAPGTSGFMLHVSQADLPAGNYRVSVIVLLDSRPVRVAQSSIAL